MNPSNTKTCYGLINYIKNALNIRETIWYCLVYIIFIRSFYAKNYNNIYVGILYILCNYNLYYIYYTIVHCHCDLVYVMHCLYYCHVPEYAVTQFSE